MDIAAFSRDEGDFNPYSPLEFEAVQFLPHFELYWSQFQISDSVLVGPARQYL
jgi:hypothetical protein